MKRMFLQYSSNKDKKLILEALELKNHKDAILRGWVWLGTGVYRRTYKKGNIVVKFGRSNKCKAHIKELNYYLSVSKHHRKYLARIFAIAPRRIVQRYIKMSCSWNKNQTKKGFEVLNKLKIKDAYPGNKYHKGHNMGIDKGVPIVFDFNMEKSKKF